MYRYGTLRELELADLEYRAPLSENPSLIRLTPDSIHAREKPRVQKSEGLQHIPSRSVYAQASPEAHEG